MKINRLNLGKIVLQKVEENGMSKAKFAELVGIARQNVDKTVFSKHSLDTDLLCRISEVLECNFFDLTSAFSSNCGACAATCGA